jgi:hypothetical protein
VTSAAIRAEQHHHERPRLLRHREQAGRDAQGQAEHRDDEPRSDRRFSDPRRDAPQHRLRPLRVGARRDAGWHPFPSQCLAVTIRSMVQLAIRCHPCVPVSGDELQGWLELEVDALRAAAPHATLRLSRLMQGQPGLDAGWLVELELAEDEPMLAEGRLADALRDMRLLGLQPTLLAPTNGSAP